MPDRWQTYPVEFKGGLVTNLSPLQHGMAAPGSARTLTNFEPSIEGGYRRIEGFSKYNSNAVTGTSSSALLGLGRFRGSTIVARSQDSGGPRLYLATTTGSHTDLSTSIQLNSSATRVRFANFNFDGDADLIIVDGYGYPCVLVGTGAGNLSQLSTPSEISGASHVVVFKEHIILANNDLLIWSEAGSATGYNTGAGAGFARIGDDITALQVFRDQLIIFCEKSIYRMSGASFAEFSIQPITTSVGCLNGDTVQEVGGDIVFLSQDSIRSLAATDKIGDFNLASASKPIQDDFSAFIQNHQYFSSTVIPSKTQYRIFGYSASITEANAQGFIGTQVMGQGGVEFHWAKTKGIQARVAADSVDSGKETAVFGHTDGYIYKLESGNDFDGDNIEATFATPYFPLTDPRTRKTIYKAVLYTDPQGSFSTDFNLKFDLAESGTIQPNTIALSNSASSGGISLWGATDARYAHGGLINNGGGYSAGVSSMAVNTLSFDSTEGLITGDQFKMDADSQVYTLSADPSVSGSVGSGAATLAFTPNLAEDVADDAHLTFTKIAGNSLSTYSGDSLKKVFETQTVGSGFLVSMSFVADSTDPPYSFDAATLEFGQYGRR